jgi:DNA-binding transcriptional LysR family regulator
LLADCAGKGLRPDIWRVIASEHARLQLAAAGLGVTFVTSAFLGYAPDRLVTRKLPDLDRGFTLELVWRRANERASVVALLNILKELRRDSKA